MDSGAGILFQIVAFCFLGVDILIATNFRTPTERFEIGDALVGISAFFLLFWGLSKILIYGRARELAHLAIYLVAFFRACRFLHLDTLTNKSMMTSICTGLAHLVFGNFHVFGPLRNENLLNQAVKVFGVVVLALDLCSIHQASGIASGSSSSKSTSSTKEASPEPTVESPIDVDEPQTAESTTETPVTTNEPDLTESTTDVPVTANEHDSPGATTEALITANGPDASPAIDKTARSATYIRVKNPSMTSSHNTVMCESAQTPREPNEASVALKSSSNSMLPSPIMEIQCDDALHRPVMGSHSAQVSRRAAVRDPKRSALRTQRVAARKHEEAMAARKEARLRSEAQQKTTAAQAKTEAHDVCELEGLLQKLSLEPTPEQHRTEEAERKEAARKQRKAQAAAQKLSEAEEKAQRKAAEAQRTRDAKEQAARQEQAHKVRQAEEEAARKEAARVLEARLRHENEEKQEALKKRQAEAEARRRREIEEQAAREIEVRKQHEREVQDRIRKEQEAAEQTARDVEARKEREDEARKEREAAEQAVRDEEVRRQLEDDEKLTRELEAALQEVSSQCDESEGVDEMDAQATGAAEQVVRDEELREQLEHDEQLTRELEAALQEASSQREGIDEMDAQATGAALGVADAPETQMGDDEDDEPPAQPLQNEKLAQDNDVEMPDGQMPQQAGEPLSSAPVLQQEPAPLQPTMDAPTLFTHPVASAAANQQRPRAIPMPFSSRPQFQGQSLAAILSSTTPTAGSGSWSPPNMRKGTPRAVRASDDEYRPVRDRIVAPSSKHLKRSGEAHGESTADLAARKRPASETFVAESATQTEAQLLTRPEFGGHGAIVTWVPQSNSDLAFKTTAISRLLEEMHQEVFDWRYPKPPRSERPTLAELQAYSDIDTEMRSKMIDRTRDIETMLIFYANQDNVKLFASPEAPPAIFDNGCRKVKLLVQNGQLMDKLLNQPTVPSADPSRELERKKAEEDIKLVCQRLDELAKAIGSFLDSVKGVNKGNRDLQNTQPAYDKTTWDIRRKSGDWMMRKGVVYQAWIAKGAEWAKFGGGNATLV